MCTVKWRCKAIGITCICRNVYDLLLGIVGLKTYIMLILLRLPLLAMNACVTRDDILFIEIILLFLSLDSDFSSTCGEIISFHIYIYYIILRFGDKKLIKNVFLEQISINKTTELFADACYFSNKVITLCTIWAIEIYHCEKGELSSWHSWYCVWRSSRTL